MKMKVGFIGLGIMGRPMAKNLLNAGVELLVSDLNKEAVADVVAAGAKEATYAEIGEQCGRIIIMVPSGAISKSILFDEDGVASTIKEGTVVCDMSSVTPVESKECYEGLKDKGVGFVDAPVSGGEPGAVAGTLAIMAGGDQEDFDAMKEYFDILGSSALLIGGSGSGSVTKLANQVIVNNTIAVVSEAFVLATKAGADPEKVYQGRCVPSSSTISGYFISAFINTLKISSGASAMSPAAAKSSSFSASNVCSCPRSISSIFLP